MLRRLLPPPTDAERAVIARAKARLDRLHLYPTPVDVSRVRIVHTPWFFLIPGMRRFHGYEAGPLILLRRSLAESSEDLVVHELCHVWQLQFRPLRVWLSYARPSTFARDRSRYRANRYEVEARQAVEATRQA
jgi:hypothetical protein